MVGPDILLKMEQLKEVDIQLKVELLQEVDILLKVEQLQEVDSLLKVEWIQGMMAEQGRTEEQLMMKLQTEEDRLECCSDQDTEAADQSQWRHWTDLTPGDSSLNYQHLDSRRKLLVSAPDQQEDQILYFAQDSDDC